MYFEQVVRGDCDRIYIPTGIMDNARGVSGWAAAVRSLVLSRAGLDTYLLTGG